MIALIRLSFMALIGLSLLYVLVSLYSRSVRREKLEHRAEDEIAAGTLAESDRDAYIRDGMAQYERSLRRKLIWGVIIIPVIAIVGLVYVMNFM